MNFKPKIKSLLTHIPLIILAIVCTLTLNITQVHASSLEAIAVDILGVSGSGSSDRIPNGIASRRTGFLCYMLTADGNTVGEAYAFKSPGFTDLGSTYWKVQSRKGHTVTSFRDNAPWNLPPFNKDKSTNQAAIREWMEGTTNGVMNATNFVNTHWGLEDAEKFLDGEYVLVVETLLHFQFSVPTSSSKPDHFTTLEVIKMIQEGGYVDAIQEMGMTANEAAPILKDILNNKLDEMYANNKYATVGSPIIGTDKDCLAYYQAVVASQGPNWFKSYLNKIVPFAEFIRAGGPGEQAKFDPWIGSTGSQISDSDVNTYGVGMFVVKAKNNAINTYDPSQGSPGPAEDPTTNPSKQGPVTIVKGYYTEDELTQTKISDGVYTQPNTTNKINIMEEPEYQLVSWNISTDAPTTPDPAGAWISTPKGGITPTSVTLETNEKTLYVLLKKVEAAPPEVGNELWVLNESEITAQVSTANKEASNGTDLKLTVTLPTLEKCNGHYKEADPGHSADCEETCTQSHKYGWTDYCTSWTLDDKSFSLITKNTNEDNTATSKNVLAKDSLTSRNILFRNQVKAYPAPVVNALFFCKSFRQKLHSSTCTKASFFSLK